jgi:hypothetical protein
MKKVLFVIGGVCLLIGGVLLIVDDVRFFLRAEQTVGSVAWGWSRQQKKLHVFYSVRGEQYEGIASSPLDGYLLNPDEPVAVFYDPQNPWDWHAGPMAPRIGMDVVLLFFVLGVYVGGGLLIRWRSQNLG